MTQTDTPTPPRAELAATTNRSAIEALVLSITGIAFFGLTSPFAWRRANQALAEIDAEPERWTGRGMATASRIIGMIGTVYLAAFAVLFLFFGFFEVDMFKVLQSAVAEALGPNAIVLCLAAIGLNVHFGYTGLLNFGQAGFMAVSAYGLAVSVVTIGVPFWPAVVISLVTPVVLALVLGLPTLRLRADYLAIATIATAEILRLVFGSVELADTLGGSNGINGFDAPFQSLNPYEGRVDLGFIDFSARNMWAMTVGWPLVGLCLLLVWALMRSPWGRLLRSIREDEDAVRSLGKNVFAYKMQALILGGVFGGLAGLFLALKQGSVVPTDYSTNITFYAFTALLIGGAARVLGPLVGAMIFWFLLSGLRDFFSQATAGGDPLMPEWLMNDTQASLVRFVATGLGLMLLMIFRPQGIFGDRKELAIDER